MMISSWRGFWVILIKEITDNLRDRRTLTTMALSIVIGPGILFAFLWFAEKTIKEETNLIDGKPIELAVIGADRAPNLMGWLAQNNIKVISGPVNPVQAIRNGEHRVVLVIDEEFSQAYAAGETAPVRLIHDSSVGGVKSLGFTTIARTIQLYSTRIANLRLQARGISPQVMQPIGLNQSDVASPQARNAEILSMMPYLIIIFIMAGGMYLAIDTTAGEREHGSLESLLAQPIDRRFIVLAKLTATVVFSALTLLLVLVSLGLAFEFVPIDSLTVSLTPAKISKILIGCLPFVFLGCALMVLVASFTQSYKEAQSYLGMVMLVPSMPLIILGFLSPEPTVANMWIPSLSQGLIIIETLKGEQISAFLLALSMSSTMIFAALLSLLAVKLYQRESILG